MIHYITDVMEPMITGLPYVERYGGLVIPMEHDFTEDKKGPAKKFPISPKVNYTECFNTGKYKMIAPDSNYRSIFWLEEIAPMSPVASKDGSERTQRCTIRVVGFLNLGKLNIHDENKDFASPQIALHLKDRLEVRETLTSDTTLSSGKVGIKWKGQLLRDKAIFGKWSFGDMAKAALLYPLDCLAMDFECTLKYQEGCINDIVLGTPIDECLTIW